MANLQYTATKSNAYGASAGASDPYFGYQTYGYTLSEGALGNSHVVDILSASISNANTNGGSSSGVWRMRIDVQLNGNWYTLGYIQVGSQTSTHQTFSDWHDTADASTKSLMGKYPPLGIRGCVIDGYFHVNAGSQIILNATTALDYTPSTLSFTAAGVNAGEAIGVNISRMSADLTHTVDYYFGSEHIQRTGIGTYDALTIPLGWLNQIPNSTSGTCTCTVTTLYGSTVVGSNTGYFTISAGPGVKPSLASLTAAGVEQYWGLYVQGKSRAQLTANGAAGAYGSTPQSIHIWGPANDNAGANPFTTGYLSGAGNNVFYATVTDSRGRTSDPVSRTISVTAYSAPSFVAVDALRSGSDGTLADEGVYARCTASYAWSAIGSNTVSVDVHYRETGTSSWTLGSAGPISSGGYVVIGGGLAIDKSYDVMFRIWDYFTSGSPTPAYDTIQTAKCLMDWLAGGNGVSFGLVAAKPGVEISPDWPFYANGDRIGTPSNPNLLINGDFRAPINQRGLSAYTSGGYTIDRWVLGGVGQLLLASDYVHLYATTSDNAYFVQRIESPRLLAGQWFTLTIRAALTEGMAVLYANDGAAMLGSLYISSGAGWQEYTTTFQLPTSLTYLEMSVAATGNSNIAIQWAKCEAGTVKTPFVPRPAAQEVAMCQRYYEKINDCVIKTPAAFGFDTIFYYKVTKRATPTVTVYSLNGTPNKVSFFSGSGWVDWDYDTVGAFQNGIDGVRIGAHYSSEAHFGFKIVADAEIY